MNTKRGAAKGVSLAKRKANVNAFDKLGDNPTEQQLKEAAATVALAELEERVADVRDSWETDSLFEDVFEDLANNPAAAKKSGEFCPRLSFPFSAHFFISISSLAGHVPKPCIAIRHLLHHVRNQNLE
jgi:hypothetical protein